MVSSYARTKEASQAKYISILNIIQGEVDPTQVISLSELLEVGNSWCIVIYQLAQNLCFLLMETCTSKVTTAYTCYTHSLVSLIMLILVLYCTPWDHYVFFHCSFFVCWLANEGQGSCELEIVCFYTNFFLLCTIWLLRKR